MSKQVRWQGKYIRVVTDGPWEYVERCGGVSAVVIIAEHDGKVVLVEQYRTPLGRRCLELPAGLVGDEDDNGVEETALKELEEETGFVAASVERLGRFHSSPGMVAEGFDLVKAHGVSPGGAKSEEDIAVHLVERENVAEFVDSCRERGLAVDAKLLLLLGASSL
ncbi:NUDIX hydrolase [Sphingomonas sp. HDW15A]|uniref:NUDIX hydrolase n=1 Tax=Sphingomonas sp. HDW15A TaxID=2714942 RepID=UPI00140DDD97|nr:NUDIX hydrolase [Sphingomonas sp. HDW15A]QIK96366.1 NUDIX hydrolase [Sphingomonas sp. HDW15A]